MAIRQKEEQAGKRVNLPAVLCRSRHGGRFVRAFAAILVITAMLAAPLTAYADDSPDDQTGQTIAIEQSTPIVTASSGFHITVAITNASSDTAPAGSLILSTNSRFTFVSRTDMQKWAEGDTAIPTPDVLGSIDVPEITPGNTATVTLDVAADQQALQSMRSWGPKPLQLSYSAGNQPPTMLPSFLTRSPDGLDTAQTPAMNLTVAMPLTTTDWQVDSSALSGLVSEDENASAEPVLSVNQQETTTVKELNQTLAKHHSLQVVADPLYFQELPSDTRPAVAGVMQPGDFDVTAYAALNDADAYTRAGIADEAWNAEQAQTLYAVAKSTVTPTATYAWQGSGTWSLDALTKARAQGYTAVIADSTFDGEQTDTVHTGTYVVNTSAGDITVLKEQSELGTLAHGEATSARATAEASDAGRLARMLAQSAFYQMEQPYATRNLLMTFSRNSSASWINQVMSAMEQASWLNLTDLNTMAAADPYNVSSEVNQDDSNAADVSQTRATLEQLASSRKDILRLATSILKKGLDEDDVSSLNPQALARQDASSTASHTNDPAQWVSTLLNAHDDIALHAFAGSSDAEYQSQIAKANRTFADTVLGSVYITPSESVSVFSESAQMPVTVSNKLPYAVSVKVNSITDSMQIVTSRSNDVVIPARSEAQVTFTIRVSTSGTTVAHVSLADRHNTAFGNTQDTTITSVLRISDASGFVIIGFAVLLGLVGLWRQFNRKKDPDE